MVVSSHLVRLRPLYAMTLTLTQLVFGVNFAESRLVKSALESFYGVGPQISQRLMARLSIHNTARLSGLGHRTVNDLSAELQNLTIENNLRRKLQDNIKRLRDMGTYRGRRHAMSLPVRGQRTRTQVCPQYILFASPKLTPSQDRNRQKVEQSRPQRLIFSIFLLLYNYLLHGIGWRNGLRYQKFSFPCTLILTSTFYAHAKHISELLPNHDSDRTKLKARGDAPSQCPVLSQPRYATKTTMYNSK